MTSRKTSPAIRRHDFDDLKVFLTDLVIVHHTAIAYGGVGGGFRSPLISQDALTIPLVFFEAVNQTYFMALFFYISGRMSAQGLHKSDRDPAGSRVRFMGRKAWRLGIPAVFYTAFVHPLIQTMALREWTGETILNHWMSYLPDIRFITGPLWYNATLLAFDLAAATIPWSYLESLRAKSLPFRRWRRWLWTVVAVAGFFTRLQYPVGVPLLILGCQPAHLPQYIFAYTVGFTDLITETAQGVETPKPPSFGFWGLRLPSAIMTAFLTIPLILVPALISDGSQWTRRFNDFAGGWNAPSLVYAFWQELCFAIIGPAMLAYFARRFFHEKKSPHPRTRFAYGAFLVHAAVSTAIEVALDSALSVLGAQEPPWQSSGLWNYAGPASLTIIVGFANIWASFAAAKVLIENVPGLASII